jgi:protein-tyrosine phosphatase
VTRSHVLIRSDHVGQLTPAGRAALNDYGVTTVLDLRSAAEILKSPNPFADGDGARYVHRELIDDAHMNNLGEAGDMYQRYLFILRERQRSFGDIFTLLAEAEDGVVFHCFAGKDRTGLVAAMLLSLAGVALEHIAADYGETDRQLAKQYEVWVSEAPAEKRDAFREELRCPPERIVGVLEYLETRWGGVEGYLEAAGVTPANVDRLSVKLT